MTTRYAERLRTPISWWVVAVIMILSTWLALIVPLPPALAWAISIAIALGVLGALATYGSLKVEVTDTELIAGRAHIGWEHVGAATHLDREATQQALGVKANALAWLATRGYIPESVKVEITDPGDPAPYWLISSRHPERLVAAIDTARSAAMTAP